MKYLFKEDSFENKKNQIIEIYIRLLESNNNKSKKIMLLVPNNITKVQYDRKINVEFSEEIKITTYLNFIKKELIKFWPIVLQSCDQISKKLISPIFIPNSLSEYIIKSKVNEKRNIEGYFQDITATNRNIANSINTNINKGALALIDFKTIGEKIYLSKKNRDNIMRFSYSQMNEIIDYYTDLLLSNSMIDNSISIYLYNEYLLKNDLYLENLKNDTDYLIVDSLEACSNAEVDFIDLISDYDKDTYIYFNNTRDYSVFNNIDMEYINEKIIEKFNKEANCNNLNNLKESIKRNILIEDIYLLPTKINLNESSQLYNEMIDQATNKVIALINEGISPSDIAIISPINNTVLDYQVSNILNNNNIEVFNTKKDKKIIDYPYANALVTASCIFYGYEDCIKEEEYISFIEIILNVNRIQAFKIFRNKEESEEYKELEKYIASKKENDIKISEFLIQFYIDKILNLKEGRQNVGICKQIIYESESFTENVSLLGLDKNKDKEKIFIEALKTTINDYYAVADIEELKNSEKVLITTPYSYISYNVNRPIQIWVDIGSNAWNMKIEKDISNVVILRKSFEERRIYTDSMEEYYRKYYLYNMVYNLLINAKEVYAYKSEYTVNGYIQESILYSLLLKVLAKGEDSYE